MNGNGSELKQTADPLLMRRSEPAEAGAVNIEC